jgi:hypothetical protein
VEAVEQAVDDRGEQEAGDQDQGQPAVQGVQPGEHLAAPRLDRASGPIPDRIMAALTNASIQAIPSR